MDISSAEPGTNAGEPKSNETAKEAAAAKEANMSSEKASFEAGSSSEFTHSGPSSENPDVNKVLSYGPARRDDEAPEIKVDRDPDMNRAPEIKSDKAAADQSAKKDAQPGSALIPFVGKAKEQASEKPKDASRAPRFEMLRSRGMQAALVAACVGIAWAAAGALYSDHSAKVIPLQTASLPVASAEPRHAAVAPENSETRRLSEDIRALKKELDGLRSSMAQNPAPEELRAIKKSVDSLKGGLEGTKAEMASSLAQLSSKLDKAQHDPAKLREISDRLDHMERAAPLTTASIAPPQESPAKPATVPLPPAKAQSLSANPAPAAKPAQTAVAMTSPTGEKPQLIANWVVRDVYDGIALVEGPHGSVEVIEGETIPGAGTVKSIERRGSGWIVLTSRGLVDSARN